MSLQHNATHRLGCRCGQTTITGRGNRARRAPRVRGDRCDDYVLARYRDQPCAVPKLDAGLWLGVSLAGLGGSSIFVDHAAEDSATSDRGVAGDRGGGIVGWWVLVQALVRAVVIEGGERSGRGRCGRVVRGRSTSGRCTRSGRCRRTVPRSSSPGRAGRDVDHVDALGGEHGIEGISELGIPVADQERNEAA